MIKLYNFSKLSDDVLKRACQYPYKKNSCKGKIIIKATRGGRTTISRAFSYSFVNKWVLSTRRFRKDGKLKQGSISCNGYIELAPYQGDKDPLKNAEYFMKTIVHEFCHIYDYQNCKSFGDYNKRWANRPHEIRACNFSNSIERKQEKEYQDIVIELAIEFEQTK